MQIHENSHNHRRLHLKYFLALVPREEEKIEFPCLYMSFFPHWIRSWLVYWVISLYSLSVLSGCCLEHEFPLVLWDKMATADRIMVAFDEDNNSWLIFTHQTVGNCSTYILVLKVNVIKKNHEQVKRKKVKISHIFLECFTYKQFLTVLWLKIFKTGNTEIAVALLRAIFFVSLRIPDLEPSFLKILGPV